MGSRRPHRPRKGPAREKEAESALNDKKTPKINNWIHNSPITGFKTHLQNHLPELRQKITGEGRPESDTLTVSSHASHPQPEPRETTTLTASDAPAPATLTVSGG